MSQPLVISFVSTFLKREMLHVYRQVIGLNRYRTTVVTQQRLNADRFPFDPVVMVPAPTIGLLERMKLKYFQRAEKLVYRGEHSALRDAVGRVPADLMHVYFGHTGVHLLPFIRRWDRPVVVSFHGMDVMPRDDDPRYAEQLRELLRTVPIVLARSESLKRVLVQRGADPARVRINRTSVPFDRFPFVDRTPPADAGWAFVQACRFIEKKGLNDTLRAFAKFSKAHPAARLHLVGAGPMEAELRALAARLGIAPVFHGFLDQEALAAVYGTCHAFVHPSKTTAAEDQEGVPNSMLEAMATGLPVLATRHGGIPEVIAEGDTGFLAAEGDWEALADHMLRIAAHTDRYRTMSRAASNHVRAQFAPEKQIEALESAYDAARATFVLPPGRESP